MCTSADSITSRGTREVLFLSSLSKRAPFPEGLEENDPTEMRWAQCNSSALRKVTPAISLETVSLAEEGMVGLCVSGGGW